MATPLQFFVTTILGPLYNAYRNVYLEDGRRVIRGLVYVLLTSMFIQDTNLRDFSTEEELTSVQCTEADFKFRKADGSCNHRTYTAMGMKGMRFGRNTKSKWEQTTPPDNFLWSPRPEEAAKLLTSYNDERVAHKELNLFFGAWIQFMTHDWFNHQKDEEGEAYMIGTRTPNQENGKEFPLKPTKRDGDGYMRTTVTHWWDMSQVYGSDQETADSLRSFVNGELTLQDDGLIPKDNKTGVIKTGFSENMWSGLEALHTLFAKEHNWIASELKKQNPTWDDERLYQTARLINAAQAAIIHTEEWTAILLQNRPVTLALKIGTRGIETVKREHRDVFNFLDRGALSILEALDLPGVHGIGDETELRGDSAFSQTEDFVSVYRMHSLLPDNMTVSGETKTLLDHSFKQGRTLVEEYGMAEVFKGMADMNTHQLVLHNFPKSLSNLRIGKKEVLDMAAVDIFRDRERGIPKFNDFRAELGLDRFTEWEEINSDPKVVAELKATYKTIDDIDTQVGMAAEEVRPHGFAISETTFFIFLAQTTRRLHADRFFQESFNEETYTAWGLSHVMDSSFRSIIERHYPSALPAFPVTSAFLHE